MNYKLGDRVRCIKTYGFVNAGNEGVVVDIVPGGDPPIGVRWNQLRSGHNCNGRCDKPYGYYVPEECITLAHDPVALAEWTAYDLEEI